MSAPIFSSAKFRPGVDGAGVDDDAPIIGAMDTDAELVPTDPDTRLANISYPTDDTKLYYGGGYIDLDSDGSMQAARVALRSGMQPNLVAGPMQLVSTAGDTGPCTVSGRVSGVIIHEVINLAGLTPVVTSNTWDAASEEDEYDGALRVDYGEVPLGNVTASIGGQTLGVIWRTVTIGDQVRLGTILCSVEWKIALADELDAVLSSDNRLTAPEDISDFSRATRWPGSDQALTVPGGVLPGGSSIGWVEEFTALVGMVPAKSTNMADVALVGTPAA